MYILFSICLRMMIITVVVCACIFQFVGGLASLDHDPKLHRPNRDHHIQKRETACYRRLGCFSNGYPYNNSGEILPEDPDIIQTTFNIFTRTNPHDSSVVLAGHYTDLRMTNFILNATTKFIIHGFIQHGEEQWIKNMTSELLRRENMNVIVVDWGRGAAFPYEQAVANTRVVGAEVAGLIMYFVQHGYITTDIIHIIGHSLGSHVAGYAGGRVDDLGRITGLDPAEPAFQGMDPAVRLDSTDAMFVDVIHTDGSSFSTVSGYGMSQAVGHMDFYPNGGVHQPGCSQVPWLIFVTGMYGMNVQDVKDHLGCSHSRAISLFTESINSACMFTSYQCHDYTDFEDGLCLMCFSQPCPTLGLDSADSAQRGKFYLKTHSQHPFCGYQYYVTINTGGQMSYASGVLSLKLIGENGRSAETDLHKERRTFLRSRVYKTMLLTSEEIYPVSAIQLHFSSRSFFIWSSSTITITRVSVMVGSLEQTIYFCPDQLEVGEEPVTLSTTSNDSSSCEP